MALCEALVAPEGVTKGVVDTQREERGVKEERRLDREGLGVDENVPVGLWVPFTPEEEEDREGGF